MARTRKSQTQKPELEVVSSDTIVMPAAHEAPVNSDSENAPPPVGEQLRRERERRGISIEAVAQMLKIRRVYLKAIEESNWDELPEPVYVNGFIRSYANFLGLNVIHTIPSAKTEIINLPALPKLEIPQPIDDQQLPSVTTIILAALGLFFLYAVWIAVHPSSDDNSASTSEPAITAQSATPDTTSSTSTPTPTLLDQPALVQSNDGQSPTTSVTPEKTVTTTPTAPTQPIGTTYGAAAPTRAIITATQDSWIQIQSTDKHVVYSGVLRAGDSYRVPDNTNLLLTTTNLSGLKFTLDGKPEAPPADAQSSIDQSFSLTPDHFLKANAPPAAQTTQSPATPKPTPIVAVPKQPKAQTQAPMIAHKPTHVPPVTVDNRRGGPGYAPPESDAEDSTSDDTNDQ